MRAKTANILDVLFCLPITLFYIAFFPQFVDLLVHMFSNFEWPFFLMLLMMLVPILPIWALWKSVLCTPEALGKSPDQRELMRTGLLSGVLLSPAMVFFGMTELEYFARINGNDANLASSVAFIYAPLCACIVVERRWPRYFAQSMPL